MSLEFRDPTINDKQWVSKILRSEKKINSESVFGTGYIWSDHYSIKICQYENMLIKKVTKKNTTGYEFPQGAKSAQELEKAVSAVINDAKESGYNKLLFIDFLDSEVKKIEEIFPEKFKFVPVRDDFEYIYAVKDLALLPGKKYHSKRNHISKFSKTFKWNYKPMVYEDKNRYLNFFEKWFKSSASEEEYKNAGEHDAIKKALENFKTLEFSGGIIEIEGEIIACTIGEKIKEDTFLIHFEKALAEFSDAYSVINNEFCKTLLGKYKFVNREEDMGIPGLRKAKLSYRPVILLAKYDAVLDLK